MSQETMYAGIANSPQTELFAAIDDVQDTITVADASKLPPAPNIATIGSDETAETVLYTGVSGNDLTGVTRGFEGVAKSWSAGSKVARNFTAYDHAAAKNNIEDHESRITAHLADEAQRLKKYVPENQLTSLANKLNVINNNVLFYSDFGGWEMDTIMETTTIKSADGVFHRWYRVGDGTPTCAVGYASSTDGVTFTRYTGNPLTLEPDKGDRFPTVVEYNGKYLMFIKEDAHGYYYLYDVTDPINPVIMNNGNPIITTDLYNLAVTVVGNRIHVLAEDPGAGFGLRYTYADYGTFDFDVHLTGILISGGGNGWLRYIPERNALLAVYGVVFNGYWKIVSAYASLSDNLSLASSWHQSTALDIAETNVHIADPDLFVTDTGGSKNLIIAGSYAQAPNYQWNSSLTLLQFYDNVVSNTSITMTPDAANPTMDVDNEKWTFDPSRVIHNSTLILNNENNAIVTRQNSFSDDLGYAIRFTAQKAVATSRITVIPRYIDNNNYARIFFDSATGLVNYQEKITGVFGTEVTLAGTNPFADLLKHNVTVVVGQFGENTVYVDGKYIGSAISTSAFIGKTLKIGFTAFNDSSWYSSVVVTQNNAPRLGTTIVTNPTLLNGVTNFNTGVFDSIAYYKDTSGFVHLEGFAATVPNGTVMFTLPAGYRPKKKKRFATVGNDAFAVIEVADNGAVTLITGSGTSTLSLNVAPFRAEQ